MARPFRFGVQVSQAGSAAEWRDKARKIEDLGYSTLFMPDHFGQELAPMPAIAMALASMAPVALMLNITNPLR